LPRTNTLVSIKSYMSLLIF